MFRPAIQLSLTLTILLTGQMVGAAAEWPDLVSGRAQDLATLRQGFAQPPREAGPWVFWFWWNSVVSREEIARELEEMAAAGLAGAELRVVTFHGWAGEPLAGMDPATLDRLGHRQLKYLSDDWLDMMEFIPGPATCPGRQKWKAPETASATALHDR